MRKARGRRAGQAVGAAEERNRAVHSIASGEWSEDDDENDGRLYTGG
ncbi:MAG: hypothetical protein K0Q94_5726 [Paenibacillus sp.]|nr:hypothetical protein [Paenibacillus sp.]